MRYWEAIWSDIIITNYDNHGGRFRRNRLPWKGAVFLRLITPFQSYWRGKFRGEGSVTSGCGITVSSVSAVGVVERVNIGIQFLVGMKRSDILIVSFDS